MGKTDRYNNLAAQLRIAKARIADIESALEYAPPQVEALVQYRLERIRPALRAQTMAGLSDGLPKHSAHGLLPHSEILAKNAASHHGFDSTRPISTYSNAELRRLQRSRNRSKVMACPDDEDTGTVAKTGVRVAVLRTAADWFSEDMELD